MTRTCHAGGSTLVNLTYGGHFGLRTDIVCTLFASKCYDFSVRRAYFGVDYLLIKPFKLKWNQHKIKLRKMIGENYVKC